MGQQMKRHLNDCSGLAPPPMTMLQESVRGEHSPKKSVHGPNMKEARRKAVILRNHDQLARRLRRTLKLGIGA